VIVRRIALALAVAMVVAVSSSALTWKRNALFREIEMDADTAGRYCDMGIRLRVIVRDEANGKPLIDGIPPVRVVREHRLGGMVDLWGDDDGRPTISGPSKHPVIWYASEAQESLVLHDDAAPKWTLVQGSEGSGKTYTLAMWSALRVLEHLGHDREIGLTAPITRRMEHVRKAIRKLWPAHWYTLHETKGEYRFRAGPIVTLVSAHTSRRDEGSPIQGANWVAHGGDELQDHFDKEPDIQARGRAAPNGLYKRLNTSTAKDSPEWRTFRGIVETSPELWRFVRVLGMENPLIPPSHWENLRKGGQYTPREWDRRVLALDVAPERQVYHCWSRKLADGSPGNLRLVPLGAVDVTAETLAAYGDNIGVLIGHDPGTRQHVSEFLKAYRLPADVRRGDLRPRWFVVDEVTTPSATVHAHASAVLKQARDRWYCNTLDRKGRPDPDATRVLVRIDPHTRSGEAHPGQDLYAVWRSLGMTARAAAYTPGTTMPATIKKLSRIDMVNTLLCAVSAEDVALRRLFVACDDHGAPAAPKLVAALESMESNDRGQPEAEAKDENDMSHWPCALGYALWQVEHHRIGKAAA
jgi:hypothetical protein